MTHKENFDISSDHMDVSTVQEYASLPFICISYYQYQNNLQHFLSKGGLIGNFQSAVAGKLLLAPLISYKQSTHIPPHNLAKVITVGYC